MVKGDKRNKREFERKQRQEGGGSVKAGDGKSNEKKAGAVRNDRSPEREVAKPPSNFQGVKEDAAKLITEANQRFLEENQKQMTSQQMEDQKWKKTVTSNWDRYEIPSEDEVEDEMTGEAWDVALSSGNSSQSHIRLKDEESWSTSGGTQLSKEFFNLDINILDDLLKNIPLFKQIDLDLVVQDEETFEMFNKKAEAHRQLDSQGGSDSTEITHKMMSLLTSSPPKQQIFEKIPVKNIKTPDTKDKRESNLIKAEDVKLKEEKPVVKPEDKTSLPVFCEPQEQRQRRNRSRKVESSINNQSEQNILTKEEPTESKIVGENVNIKTTEKVINESESDDLQFLESLENSKNANSLEPVNTEETSESLIEKVVPVSIIDDKEKKGLEDWLDDFLGD